MIGLGPVTLYGENDNLYHLQHQDKIDYYWGSCKEYIIDRKGYKHFLCHTLIQMLS